LAAADSRWRSAASDHGNGGGAQSAPVTGGEYASSSRFTSWRVTYARLITGRNSPFLDGILIIRHDLKMVTLLDDSERILVSRDFLPGEVFSTGGPVSIGIFSIRIPLVPLSPSSLFPMRSVDGPRCSSELGDFSVLPPGSFSEKQSGPQVDGSLPHSHRQVAPTSLGNPSSDTTYSAFSAPWSDLDLICRHLWSSPNPSTHSHSESFGWWPGKVAGDLRSFSQVGWRWRSWGFR
jgi:hypothetical protein